MENIRRSVRLFFVSYGSLLFQIIGIIVIVLFVLRVANHLYTENTENEVIENEILQEEIKENEQTIKKQKENISFISEFLDYCNKGQVEEAYSMLSDKCIKEKFQTIDIFKTEYLNKIFTYKKEYEIENENNLYKVTILEGVLESGGLENRKSIITHYRIEENVLENKIYIER